MAKDLAASIEDAEAEYRTLLVAALEHCARGRWGLFGQNAYPEQSADADALLTLGAEIATLRERAGLDRFDLHEAFVTARGRPCHSNALGEARLATEWLERLSAS